MSANNIARLSFSTSKDKVTSTKRINLEENAVVTAIIDNGAITTDKLGNGSVTTDKLGNGSVTTDKLGNGSVTTDKLADGAVTLAKIHTGLSTGVVHSDASGNLTSTLISNNDIHANAAIADSKLATISTSGKVANTATTATSSNTANTIVSRDASGNILGITQPLNTNNTTMATTAFIKNAFDDLKAGVGTAYDTLKEIGDALDANITAEAAIINTLSEKANLASPTFTGTIKTALTTGVVHSDASGVLTSSLIINADISSSAAIADTKLATISTSGKVLNSATTATSANTASAIVSRDASGNFSAGSITVTGERITSFSTGIVHSDVSGNLSSSLITGADITNGTITGDKLAAAPGGFIYSINPTTIDMSTGTTTTAIIITSGYTFHELSATSECVGLISPTDKIIGKMIYLFNNSTKTISIYPPNGTTFLGSAITASGTSNTATSPAVNGSNIGLNQGKTALFIYYKTNTWFVTQF